MIDVRKQYTLSIRAGHVWVAGVLADWLEEQGECQQAAQLRKLYDNFDRRLQYFLNRCDWNRRRIWTFPDVVALRIVEYRQKMLRVIGARQSKFRYSSARSLAAKLWREHQGKLLARFEAESGEE